MKHQGSWLRRVRPALFLAGSLATLAGSRALIAQEVDHEGGGCGLYAGRACAEVTKCISIPGTDVKRCTTDFTYYYR